jgi:methylmalonyl-CoA mutase
MATQPTSPKPELHVPVNPVRIVTASALFDGHDASINIMRRIMQSQGAEVIHLGHNRSVQEVVDAAVEEDVQGVAVSSYQGGHVEYFEYLVQLLAEAGAGHVQVVGGGGGVIVPEEIERLRAAGVTIFSPQDGQRLGLPGMVNQVIAACDVDLDAVSPPSVPAVLTGERAAVARAITAAETGHLTGEMRAELERAASGRRTPVLGITGTGGSGKSIADRRARSVAFRIDQEDKLRIAVRRRRPDASPPWGRRPARRPHPHERARRRRRSTCARWRHAPPRPRCHEALGDVLTILKASGFDLVIVETPGIGQGDAAITSFADVNLYVMTPEFGAASQLEKIDMLDFADVVAINKFERRGAMDALRDVRRQMARNREDFSTRSPMTSWCSARSASRPSTTTASRRCTPGAARPADAAAARGLACGTAGRLARVRHQDLGAATDVVVPPAAGLATWPRSPDRASVATTPPPQHRFAAVARSRAATRRRAPPSVAASRRRWERSRHPRHPAPRRQIGISPLSRTGLCSMTGARRPSRRTRGMSRSSPASASARSAPRCGASRCRVPPCRRVVAPTVLSDDGRAAVSWLRAREPARVRFPFTAGVFPFKREGEDPARMFAGEGDAFRTNRPLQGAGSQGQPATRLSTAFDSVTLYGLRPGRTPRHLRQDRQLGRLDRHASMT